jgi:hypothetical protein
MWSVTQSAAPPLKEPLVFPIRDAHAAPVVRKKMNTPTAAVITKQETEAEKETGEKKGKQDPEQAVRAKAEDDERAKVAAPTAIVPSVLPAAVTAKEMPVRASWVADAQRLEPFGMFLIQQGYSLDVIAAACLAREALKCVR